LRVTDQLSHSHNSKFWTDLKAYFLIAQNTSPTNLAVLINPSNPNGN
jgi:hypothetical protein